LRFSTRRLDQTNVTVSLKAILLNDKIQVT
jgi:hypothetical protein